MLDFVKAMSDADRLRVIGILACAPASAHQVAADMEIPFREAYHHLTFLRYVGVVRSDTGDDSQEAIYSFNPEGADQIAKLRLSGDKQTYTPAPHLDEKSRKVLVSCLKADGTIRNIPNSRTQADRFKIILDYLIEAFTPGLDYKEKEVNSILRRFHEDVSGLRRDLVEAGLLARERDGSKYWRPKN
jgi:hypothetical protein